MATGRLFRNDSDAPSVPNAPSVADLLDARETDAAQGDWLPACNGTETPFTARSGARLLYCWQPSTGRHAYLNLDRDIVLTDEEAITALGML